MYAELKYSLGLEFSSRPFANVRISVVSYKKIGYCDFVSGDYGQFSSTTQISLPSESVNDPYQKPSSLENEGPNRMVPPLRSTLDRRPLISLVQNLENNRVHDSF